VKNFVYLKNVVTLKLDEEKCIGCGMCEVVCPHAVFSNSNKLAKIDHKDACMECGACAQNCIANAISVQAGVGCAAAVINTALGRDGACSCVVEIRDPSDEIKNEGCC